MESFADCHFVGFLRPRPRLTATSFDLFSGKLHQPKKEEAASAEEGGSCISRLAPSLAQVLECFGRNSVTLHHIALVFRCRVLGTTPPRGGAVPAGENGSLLGKQSVVVLSDYCIRRRPKKEAVSAEEGSCISLVRSKVMRAVQAFCFHIGGPPCS